MKYKEFWLYYNKMSGDKEYYTTDINLKEGCIHVVEAHALDEKDEVIKMLINALEKTVYWMNENHPKPRYSEILLIGRCALKKANELMESE